MRTLQLAALAAAGVYLLIAGVVSAHETWTASGTGASRRGHTATLLDNGKVVVFGGSVTGSTDRFQIFDPSDGTWGSSTQIRNLTLEPPTTAVSRRWHTATKLNDGRVYLYGGINGNPSTTVGFDGPLLYDPNASTNQPFYIPTTLDSRIGHTATLLTTGEVLIVGGATAFTSSSAAAPVATANSWDPGPNSWTSRASMSVARRHHAAVLLQDGRVLVAGGLDSSGAFIASFEIYDRTANSWSTAVSFSSTGSVSQVASSAALMPDGKVFFMQRGLIRIINPATNSSAALPDVAYTSPDNYCETPMVTMLDGRVMGMGLFSFSDGRSQWYQPETATLNVSAQTLPVTSDFDEGTLTLLKDGRLLLVGGGSTQPNIINSSGSGGGTAYLFAPASGAWTAGASMSQARTEFSATTLPNSKVVAIGGEVSGTATTACELFDPTTATWEAVNPLPVASKGHRAIMMENGDIVTAGGLGASGTPHGLSFRFQSSSNTWGTSAPFTVNKPTLNMLADGRVLATGGENSLGAAVNTVRRYNSTAAVWSFVTTMGTARKDHNATFLGAVDQRVLITGGLDSSGILLNSTEYYSSSGTMSGGPAMGTARRGHVAVLLHNGKVLVAGGRDAGTNAISSAELFGGSSFTATGSMTTARWDATATVMFDGKVLVAGGQNGSGRLKSSEIYDPSTGKWTAGPDLATALSGQATAMLPDGRVMMVGGNTGSADTAETYFYRHRINGWHVTTDMPGTYPTRAYAGVATMADGRVLVSGGHQGGGSGLNTSYVFDPAAETWTATGNMLTQRKGHSLTLLDNSKILAVGGSTTNVWPYGTLATSAELFDPSAGASGQWSSAATPSTPRQGHVQVLLPDSRVLIAGGRNSSGTALDSAEVYRWWDNTWQTVAPMATARELAAGVLLQDDRVLVVGPGNTAEIYDPNSNTWSDASSGLSYTRYAPSVALLPNGKVILAGGRPGLTSDSVTLGPTVTELYDPGTNTWSDSGATTTARSESAIATLPDGRVVIGPGHGEATISSNIYDPRRGVWDRFDTCGQRAHGRLALLPGGRLLLVGGRDNNNPVTFNTSATNVIFEIQPGGVESQGAQLNAPPQDYVAMQTGKLSLTGTQLFGSGQNTQGGGGSTPILLYTRLDNERSAWISPDSSASSLSLTAFSSDFFPYIGKGRGMITPYSNGVRGKSVFVRGVWRASDIGLSNSTIADTLPSGSVVGTLSKVDLDLEDTHTFSLVSGAGATDNASFSVSGTTLYTATTFNALVKSSYSIRLQVADQLGITYEEVFPITITDATRPTTTALTPSTTGPVRSATSVNFTATFSEPMNFTSGDVVLVHSGTSGGSINVTGGPTSYTVAVSGVAGNGSYLMRLAPSQGVTDVAGNDVSNTVDSAAISVDNTAPTLGAFSPSTGGPVNSAATVTFPVSFSESVTGFTSADVTINGSGVTGGTVVITGGPQNYDVNISGVTGNGSYTVTVGTGITDGGGNALQSSVTSSSGVSVDNAGPAAPTITVQSGGVANSSTTTTFSCNFAENVSNFTTADITLNRFLATGGSVGLSGGPQNYTISVTNMTGNGSYTITVGPAITDAVGNSMSAGVNSASVFVDNTRPTLGALTPSNPGPVSSSDTVTYAATFNENTTFTAAMVSLNHTGTAGGSVNVTGSGANYTISVTGITGNGSYTITAVGFTDAAGNQQTTGVTSSAVVVDNGPPSLGALTPSNAGPVKSTATVTFPATFSESVTGFTSADVTLNRAGTTGGTVNVTGGPAVYTVSVSGVGGSGSYTVTVGTGIQDATSNSLNASVTSSAVTVDNTAPTLSALTPSTGGPVRSATTVTFPANFSESVTGFTTADVTLNRTGTTGGTVGVTGGPQNYTVSVSGVSGNGSYTITIGTGILDAAGNAIAASTTSSAVAVDNTAPTLSALTPSTAGPVASGATVTFPADFSEAVSGFTSAGVTLNHSGTAGGTIGITGGPQNYSISVDGVNGDGSYTITVGTAPADGAGNALAAAITSSAVTVDNTAPTLSALTPSTAGPVASGATVTFPANFSEAVSGFTAATVALNHTGTAGGSINVIGGPQNYTVEVADVTGDGSYTVTVGVAPTDAAGNSPAASSTSSAVAVDNTAPVPNAIAGPASGFKVDGAIEGTHSAIDASAIAAQTLYTSWNLGPWTAAGAATGATWTYSPSVDGAYRFHLVYTDAAGNVSALPVGAANPAAAVLYNDVENSSYETPIAVGSATYLFPMKDGLAVHIALSGVTAPGNLAVSRSEGDLTAVGLAAGRLVDQRLSISATGGLAFGSAEVTAELENALLGGLVIGEVNTAWRVEGATATPLPATFQVSPDRIVFITDTFSDWYFGDNNATVADWTLLDD